MQTFLKAVPFIVIVILILVIVYQFDRISQFAKTSMENDESGKLTTANRNPIGFRQSIN